MYNIGEFRRTGSIKLGMAMAFFKSQTNWRPYSMILMVRCELISFTCSMLGSNAMLQAGHWKSYFTSLRG